MLTVRCAYTRTRPSFHPMQGTVQHLFHALSLWPFMRFLLLAACCTVPGRLPSESLILEIFFSFSKESKCKTKRVACTCTCTYVQTDMKSFSERGEKKKRVMLQQSECRNTQGHAGHATCTFYVPFSRCMHVAVNIDEKD